jgi:uncharacterized membrane protein
MSKTPETTDFAGIELQASRRDGTSETIRIACIGQDAPWRWLGAGWADFAAMPRVSLAYGGTFTALAIAMALALTGMDSESAMLVLAAGFVLIGPILGVGLYEASRQRALGQTPAIADLISAGFASPGQLSLLGLVLFLVFLIWLQIAFLLNGEIFGNQVLPSAEAFARRLFSPSGAILTAIGLIIGASLAGLVFAMSVIAGPMLIARPVSASTAVFASLNAVVLNPKPMAIWAALITGFMIAGFATLCAGLLFVFPLIGYASWHAYQEIAGEPIPGPDEAPPDSARN